jgi:hypothetical protein
MSYMHLVAVVNRGHPLLDTDAVALARLLGVPSEWLRHGWSEHDATTYPSL